MPWQPSEATAFGLFWECGFWNPLKVISVKSRWHKQLAPLPMGALASNRRPSLYAQKEAEPRGTETMPALLKVALDLQRSHWEHETPTGAIYTLLECGHRNKHCGVNSAWVKERPDYCPTEVPPHLQPVTTGHPLLNSSKKGEELILSYPFKSCVNCKNWNERGG